MSDTEAKAQSVPSFWRKIWNRLAGWMKRRASCACSTENPPAAKTESAGVQEKKAPA